MLCVVMWMVGMVLGRLDQLQVLLSVQGCCCRRRIGAIVMMVQMVVYRLDGSVEGVGHGTSRGLVDRDMMRMQI